MGPKAIVEAMLAISPLRFPIAPVDDLDLQSLRA